MSFQAPITIKKAIKAIESNEYLLPAIQREFKWKHTKIEWLFDSIMRSYPISSFLFWEVNNKTAQSYKFYKFIKEYRERYKTHNQEISTDGKESFKAILDGQQRLTSLYIGLMGSYAYRRPRLHEENSERVYPTRRLYLNIESQLEEQEDGRIYEFKFLEDGKTSQQSIYENKWFRVGQILNYDDAEEFDNYLDDNFDNKFSRKALRTLRRTVHEKKLINYFLEEDQKIDKALNIFIRINSGGEPLSFSDLLMSIAVANWEKKDARKEIHGLVDNIRDKGFSISKDFVLKAFLYLYSKDIKFKVANFSKQNAEEFESEWESIRNCILTTFDLVINFGFNDYTLTSKNALLPIIYYLYHKNIYDGFVNKIGFKDNREIIKKWLHISLIKRIFGGQSDAILTQMRKAFTDNQNGEDKFDELKIQHDISGFPSAKINQKIRRDISVGDEFIDEILKTQKDHKYAFSILSVLYPYLDYSNKDFHKDHLHPSNSYKELSEEMKNKTPWNVYNSIVNLQMLNSNENQSKQDTPLMDWVENQTNVTNRMAFLKGHIIPDTDLEIENLEHFISMRKEILKEKLNEILN